MVQDPLRNVITVHHDKVLIVDFGSQVIQSIARRVRGGRRRSLAGQFPPPPRPGFGPTNSISSCSSNRCSSPPRLKPRIMAQLKRAPKPSPLSHFRTKVGGEAGPETRANWHHCQFRNCGSARFFGHRQSICAEVERELTEWEQNAQYGVIFLAISLILIGR